MKIGVVSMLMVYIKEWNMTRFLYYASFVGVTSGCCLLVMRFAARFITGNDFFM